MIIHSFPAGQFATNAYVIGCPQTKKAVIFDPGQHSADRIKSFIEKNHLTPEKILLTHSHWDHIVDVAELKEFYKIPVYIHKDDAANLENPGSNGMPLWFSIKKSKPDGFLKDNESISVGNMQIQVIHTPGHSPGGVCFYCPKEKMLITGDTLFKGTIGNLSFPTSNPDDMWESLDKLAKLPHDTTIYPGHGEITTIGAESWLARAKEIFSD